jgi:hypothetical protein
MPVSDKVKGRARPSYSGGLDLIRLGAGDPLQQFGELDCEVDAFADLACVLGISLAATQPVELVEQEFEVAGHEVMAKFRIDARALEIGIGDQSGGAHR